MKKRVAFRSFVILLATALLLSSTGAYNILVYANQDSVANSISALESASSVDAESVEPSITTQGGELDFEIEENADSETDTVVEMSGTGSITDPYIIETPQQLLRANTIVTATVTGQYCHVNTDKYFKLAADIDLSEIFDSSDFSFVYNSGNVHLISADFTDPDSEIVYINIDGSYTAEDGTTAKHKIYFSDSTDIISVTGHESFALFGYLGTNSVVSNIIFENINISVTALQPKRVSVISYMNEGRIENCEVNDCSVTLSSSTTDGASFTSSGITLYNGIAAAVADNRSAVSGVKVNNFTATIPNNAKNDYISALVGQNRGLIDSCSVSGLTISASSVNHYIGAIAGYNEPDSDSSGIQNCSVNLAGTGDTKITKNITGGGYVGGLVGVNDGYVYNCIVEGTITSAQLSSAINYNIYAQPDGNNDEQAYFGGISGANNGRIVSSTVKDLGVYMASSLFVGYFGGISAITSGTVAGCVASGSFVSNNNVVCYAGGIIGYADADTPNGAVSDCYALMRLTNSSQEYVGAVVGFGGNADDVSGYTAAGCYWSDAITGCVTAYAIENSVDASRPYSLEAFEGKLVSANRAVVVSRGSAVTVSASSLVHTFNAISGTTPATVSVEEDVGVSGSGANNTLSTKTYEAIFAFPSGIGAASMQEMSVSINLDIFITSAEGDPDSLTDPLQISSSAMAKYLYYAPYGHYKLTELVSVMSDSWVAPVFTGTLDGNDNIIGANTQIFKSIIGTRDTAPYISDYVTDPDKDTADLSGGCIKNINIQLTYDISTSLLGDVYDATIRNVTLSDGDATLDDGDSSVYEGFVAKITKAYSAPFIDCAAGKSYIYGCSTDVSVELGDYNYVGGFIGFVTGAVHVDNCRVYAVGIYAADSSKDKTSRAAFIGNTETNNNGLILNSAVSARIVGDGLCYTVIGEHKGQYSQKYSNIVWSPLDFGSSDEACDDEQQNISVWGSATLTTKTISAGSSEVYSVVIPKNISVFEDVSIEDFAVTLVNIDDSNNVTPAVSSVFSIGNTVIEDGEIKIEVTASSQALETDSIYLKIYHFDSAFQTYVKYQIRKNEFAKVDGYYNITSWEDLVKVSELCADENDSSYLSEAYKLVDNIVMPDDCNFVPIASTSTPFKGVFDGNGYTIDNLSITSDSSNAALFAAIDTSAVYTINGAEVNAGIYDLTISGANVSGTENAAILVGSVSDASATIHDVAIFDSSVLGTGKNAAAILAGASESDLNIYNITLDDVTVQTTYADGTTYFMGTTAIGGIGGVVGAITELKQAVHSVQFDNISMNALKVTGLSGSDDSYATVNAGGLVGTFHKYFETSSVSASTLTVGSAKTDKNSNPSVTLKDSLIMSAGMTGGLIGSTNAQTEIVNVEVSSAEELGNQILSTTDYYIGGVAGYIGPYTASNYGSVTNTYGTITDSVVKNTLVQATDPIISSTTTTGKTRNVSVGGIVGAINGPATGDTLLDCVVENSHIEGVVIGGIVGSNVELSVVAGNIVHITNCDVLSSLITTPLECYPVASATALATNKNQFGVGGIMGTSVYAKASYVADLVIQYCDVDADTEITNYIPYTYGSSVTVHAVTGGIIGTATQYKDTGTQALLEYNTVSAYIYTPADMSLNKIHTPNVVTLYNSLRVATGGFIGMFYGFHQASVANMAYLKYLSIKNSVFDGSILSTDCIGGAIGSVINAVGRNTTTDYLPTDMLSNLIISGSLESTIADDGVKVRGGVAIGHISVTVAATIQTLAYYTIQVKTADTDMVQAFNNVYFSSFAIDIGMFPFFGYAYSDRTNTNTAYYSTGTQARNRLYDSYIDVNCVDGNQSAQIADKSTDSEYTIPNDSQAAPSAERGIFSLDTADINGDIPHWKGSNSSLATVSDTDYSTLTVTPKNPGDVYVSIDYIGSATDGSGWSYETRLPVGFVFTSTASVPLKTVIYNGTEYSLITDPIDFKLIVDDLDGDYWLANDIVFTTEMFESGGYYQGGFTPIGTADDPFTGTLASRADGSGEAYTISGIKLAASADTSMVSGIFGYVSNAEFENFNVSDISSSVAVKYAASVAAVVNGSLTANNITVENADISGATYSAGLFGGLFGGAAGSWNLNNVSLIGTASADNSTSTTSIQGASAAAGILVHTDKNAATISGATVSGCVITQGTDDDTDDTTYFDKGAAGIAVAYSGTISAAAGKRNTVSGSYIKGEIAAGAVMRTYTSNQTDDFVSVSTSTVEAPAAADLLSISAVDISSTVIEGTHTQVPYTSPIRSVASGGILARVDALGVEHTISDCTLDSSTTVKAPYAAGGIIGTIESPSTTSNISSTKVYNVTVDGCKTEAAVSMTVGYTITGTTSRYYTMGVGGIIGCIPNFTVISGINMRNCHVGGTISGASAVGGLVGAIWTNAPSSSFSRFTSMSSHFAENCVISADFENAAGEAAFAASNAATGIVVGYVYDVSANIGNYTSDTSYNGSNEPFFNIYYSGYKYPSGSAYLFGVIKPGATTNTSMNTYACYTDTVYEMNYSYTSEKKNHDIDSQTHALIFPELHRIANTDSLKNTPEENGTWVIDSRRFLTGVQVEASALTFDVSPQTAVSALNYTFDSAAAIDRFELSAVANSSATGNFSTVAELKEVKTNTSAVSVSVSDGGYYLKPVGALAETISFDLIFVYSNGLELAVAFRVEVSGNDYYYNESANTYLVFNASNLYSTIEKASATSTIIQCYDIFCAAGSDNSFISQANTYAESVMLSDVYSAEIISLLEGSKHPNPDYDPEVDSEDKMNISAKDYLGVSDLNSLELSKLVKEITPTSYGNYSENSSDHFDFEFKGTYRVLTGVAGVNTGLTTTEGEYYSIYGFEMQAFNTTSASGDIINAGFFSSLSSAVVEGATFVNPKVKAVASGSEENFVGVLAGYAANSTIKNVSVELSGEQGEAYVINLRRMTPASANVGGVVGYATGTNIENCTVSGLDVVGATLASTQVSTTSTVGYMVKAGGIAGVFVGSDTAVLTAPVVTGARILAERNAKINSVYLAYAGGVAAWATGNITDAVVENTKIRDVTTTCEVDGRGTVEELSYTAAENEHKLVADRVGGVLAYAYGTATVDSAVVKSVYANAYDLAGGIIGEVANDSATAVRITNSIAGDYETDGSQADIRVFGSASVATGRFRKIYNAAGGAIGKIGEAAEVTVSDFSFSGYVGTYSYDNLNKDCSAGGVIGYISEELSALSAVTIYDTTVSGEVSGFFSGIDREQFIPYLGAAGGFIGKIRTTDSSVAETGLVSHSVMAATVNLYNNSIGTVVAADIDNPYEVSTNTGKILGTLIEDGNFAESATELTQYFNNIIVSTYPQDIIAFGCSDFYSNQAFNPSDCYTDINMATYTYTDENGETYTETDKSFMVGSATDLTETSFTDDNYSALAIVPIDNESGTAASASRHFRLMYDEVPFSSDSTKLITFDKQQGANIVISNNGETTAKVSIADDYADNYGTLTIYDVTDDIIGEIVITYSYGLEVSVRLISMEIEGEGTQAKPFKVSAPKHFAVVRALPDAYYIQAADIDLAPQYGYSNLVTSPLWADGEGFEPIGDKNSPFVGNYDGAGYLIKNLYINRESTSYVGFFGYVGAGAVLKNIHVEIAERFRYASNPDNLNYTVYANGGITGKTNVGGLAGQVNAATVTNCSVVKGNVIGSTAVGGLIGRSAGSVIDSCFTSTTSYSYAVSENIASTKNVGALLGYVTGTTSITGSFTFGYATLGVNGNENNGAVGGVVGYVDSGANLTVSNVFVGANVSDSRGTPAANDKYYKGLTVGSAHSNATITASNIMVSVAGSASQSVDTDGNVTRIINPVLGAENGATIADSSSVVYDSALLGELLYSDESATLSEFTLEHVNLVPNATDDAYTEAYASLAEINIVPSQKEIDDRIGDSYYVSGLFYPITIMGEGLTLTSSVMDMTDTEYPEGMDADFTGNGTDKKTDLLFKPVDGGTKVYSNIYKTESGEYNGEIYENGEMFYNESVPYFTVEKTANVLVGGGSVELYRKVIYPIQSRYENGGRVYPIATERQLQSLSENSNDEVAATDGDKFDILTASSNFTLTDNIALGDYNLNPNSEETAYNFESISDYAGYFDGNGYTVSNIKIYQPDTNNVGFIGTLTGNTQRYIGAICNLNLEIVSVKGANNVGALVGKVQPLADSVEITITDCSVTQAEDATGVEGDAYVGGLIGYTASAKNSAVSRCFTQVTVTGVDIVGGLIGYSEMPVDNSYSTGDVNASFTAASFEECGVGGLIGVVGIDVSSDVDYSFSSSSVVVDNVSYSSGGEYGVGGLVGYLGKKASINTAFSSGSVSFCNTEDTSQEFLESLPSCDGLTIGVGGLIGINYSQISYVYSSASVAAIFGDVLSASAAGIGGVIGVSNETLQNAYSSGSTLGITATDDYSSAAYGVGGVIGVIGNAANGTNLWFDLNVSVVSDAVGKVISGSVDNSGSVTTEFMTDGTSMSEKFGNEFGFTKDAYPFLTNFMADNVSRTIKLSSLLSIVAIKLNPFDVTAARGEGISMAMNIPTGVTYNDVTYSYGFDVPDDEFANSAKSIVDEVTNTLSVQRTSNTAELANFVITIKAVAGNEQDPADNVYYKDVASRPMSRICAPMLGQEDYPYLVSSQEDLMHVAMSEAELQQENLKEDSLYKDWNTPLNENGSEAQGRVYYRMMGYIPLSSDYNRQFNSLANGYSFDGNGYSIRNLSAPLAQSLDANSVITNVTFENTVFEENESLLGYYSEGIGGVLSGEVSGVNIFGTASGNNVAGIAHSINTNAVVDGCVINLDYTGTSADSFAGIALENSGLISMSASVGDISGSANNAAGIAVTNSGTIMNSFTMGDIILDSPAGSVAGFVGTNSGGITSCYTRCNIKISGTDNKAVKSGSFVAVNEQDSTLYGCYAAGLYNVANPGSKTVFAGRNEGVIEQCVFDKQISGSSFKDDFYLAVRTQEVATLSSLSITVRGAYTIADDAVRVNSDNAVMDIEYPQLSAIIATEEYITVTDEETGDVTVTEEETELSRMYRTLRSYSILSTATAMVSNDNFIDNLQFSTDEATVTTTVSDDFSWYSMDESVAKPGFYGNIFSPDGRNIISGTATGETRETVVYAKAYIEDYYNAYTSQTKEESVRLVDKLNLHVAVTGLNNPNFSQGDGTQDSPFVITNKYQFVALSYYGTNENNFFVLGNDIDFTPDSENGETPESIWSAYIDTFSANLDGCGYAVSNITIGEEGNNAVFGCISGGTVANLGLAGINITVGEGNTGSAGMLAAKVIGREETVNGETVIVGSEIANCVAVGVVSGSGSAATGTNVGGLIGETDGSVFIDGCVVSGKVNTVAGNAGGIIGSAMDGTEVSNCLSTILVSGGENSIAGGIIGNGTASVTDCIFASNVVGGIATGNISGSDKVTANNCYYDRQLSMAEGGANPATTQYLTKAEVIASLFGGAMGNFDGFDGYGVPAAFVTDEIYSDKFVEAVKLASAKIAFVNGAGAGSATAFTKVNSFSGTAEAPWTAVLSVTGDAVTYFGSTTTGTSLTADTSSLKISQEVSGEFSYTLAGTSLARYVGFVLGKTINTVTYNLTGAAGGDAVVSVITGSGNNASGATAFVSASETSGTVCDNFIMAFDEELNAYTFTVFAQFKAGVVPESVSVVFANNGESVTVTHSIVPNGDGTFTVIIPVDTASEVNFNQIDISVSAVETDVWGIHKIINRFFQVF